MGEARLPWMKRCAWLPHLGGAGIASLGRACPDREVDQPSPDGASRPIAGHCAMRWLLNGRCFRGRRLCA